MRARRPGANLLYLADQAHVPYGERTAAEILRLLRVNLTILERCGVEAIVMGCNTTCAVAAETGWPPASVPIFDVIEAGAEAVRRTGLARIAVIATGATVRSGAYERAVERAAPAVVVQMLAAPALVPFVESGRAATPEARAAVAAVCAEIRGTVEAVVYGCTHFPLLDGAFAAALGNGVLRIDPAQAQAERVAVTPAAAEAGGRTTYLTTGDPTAFRREIISLLGPLGAQDAVLSALDQAEEAEKDRYRREAEKAAGKDLQGRMSA